EVGAQIPHVEQHVGRGGQVEADGRGRRRGHLVGHSRLRGSRASRRPSPRKLTAMTVIASTTPGKNGHHQLPWRRKPFEFDSALPQLTSVARMPKLRKLTNASRTIALAKIRVEETTTGPRVLGRMWRNVIRRSLTPTALAAWTNSASRSDRKSARTR